MANQTVSVYIEDKDEVEYEVRCVVYPADSGDYWNPPTPSDADVQEVLLNGKKVDDELADRLVAEHSEYINEEACLIGAEQDDYEDEYWEAKAEDAYDRYDCEYDF